MFDLDFVAGVLPLIAAGAGVGFLIGLTGVAGAALMTPLLISTFGVSPEVAVGTDLLYASITKIAAVWRHYSTSTSSGVLCSRSPWAVFRQRSPSS
jgi:uncharacterized membrane protein YfcA